MGRVARYKKVKSIDPYAKNGSWKSDVGDCATLRRVKRKSKTALKLKEQKRSKLQRKKKKDERKGGGSNGFGDDEGYDLPPEGGDEFDVADLVGSLKKQKGTKVELMDATMAALPTVRSSASHTAVAPPAKKDGGDKKQSAKKPKTTKAQPKYDGTTQITHRTPTSEILAVHSEGTSKKKRAVGKVEEAAAYGASKQERRKVFFERKRAKKRRRGMESDDEDDDRRALESLHAPSFASQTTQGIQKQPKKHLAQQQNYTDTIVARSSLDDQVERPPTFATLPRGAHKLAKNQKKAKQQGKGALAEENDDEKDRRIQKEKREMEAMRERVIRQYAKLRESRRQGR